MLPYSVMAMAHLLKKQQAGDVKCRRVFHRFIIMMLIVDVTDQRERENLFTINLYSVNINFWNHKFNLLFVCYKLFLFFEFG